MSLLPLVAAVLLAAPQSGNQAPEAMPEATRLELDAAVRAVTVYRGRAAVTRRGTALLGPGVVEIRFQNLPETVQADTLQARCGGAGRIISVDYIERAVERSLDPAIAAIDARIEDTKRRIRLLVDERGILEGQTKLIDSVAVRAGDAPDDRTPSPALDLEALARQLEFVAQQRSALVVKIRANEDARSAIDRELAVLETERNARAGGRRIAREALVTLVSLEGGAAEVELTYLVANAGWEPTYSVRTAPPASTVTIEYDALLRQRSGEDWTDVEMVLSTAEPVRAANPPTVSPWFVEVRMPVPASNAPTAAMDARDMQVPMQRATGGQVMDKFKDDAPAEKLAAVIEGLSSDASVAGSGPAVSYRLPRTVTVLTNADREQRTRIANLDVDASFVRIAAPSLTEDVYLKAALLNTSDYQLLPGRAAIFLDGDFIGPTAIPSTAPGAEVDLHFGVDRSLRARRQLLRKEEGSAGFFGGSARVAYDYRIELDNPGNAAVAVELWDRIPVSRDERIKIVLDGPSAPLATDAEYVNEQRTQGLLKWIVQVPAGATGKSAYAITYGVRVEHPKDLDITALPE